jgi:hypothetical protein
MLRRPCLAAMLTLSGFVDRDLEAYLQPWAPDATLIIGRDRNPSSHDVTLHREQLRASKAIRFAAARLCSQHLDLAATGAVPEAKAAAARARSCDWVCATQAQCNAWWTLP